MELIKNAKRILVIFVFIFVYAILIFYNDANEEKKFYSPPGYSYQGVDIVDNSKNTDEDFDKLYKMAQEHNVFLSKTEMEYKNDNWIYSIYVSLPNTEKILNLFHLNYSLTNKENRVYASTLMNAKNPAKYKLKDFLKNKDYNVYTMDYLSKNGKYPYATYLIYYNNEKDFDSFVKEAKTLFTDFNLSDADMMDFHENSILKIGIAIFMISFLIYIVIEIFNIYKQARKISIMQLLGMSDTKIFRKIVSKDFLLYIVLPLALFLLSCIILPNITTEIMLQMIGISLAIIFIFSLLTFISVIFINHFYNIVGLLKNHQIINHLMKVGIFGKFILNILFIGIVLVTISSGQSFIEQGQKMTNSKKVADYGFFATVNMDNEQYDEKDHTNLNRLIPALDRAGLKYQYIECAQYTVSDKKDIEHTNQIIKKGEYFPFISVDINYLKENNIEVFKENGDKLSLNEESYERFIFPEAYKNYHDSFVKFYQKEQAQNTSIKSDFTMYTYNEDKLPTLSTGTNRHSYIQTDLILKQPIIRIIYKDYPNNYIDDPYGLSTAGIQGDVGIKIDTDYDKTTIYNKLMPEMKKENIDYILNSTSFATIGEFEGEAFATTQLMLYVETIVLILIFAIYTILTFEINCLYIEKEKRKLIIQSFLGYKFGSMFVSLIKYNIDIMIIIMILATVINFMFTPILDISFILIVLTMLIYEQFVLWLAARQIKLDNIPKMLKGE